MSNIVFKCKVCNKEFNSGVALGGHMSGCGLAKKGFNHSITQKNSRQFFKCPFCKKEWETTKAGFGTHKRKCYENPDRIPSYWEGKKHSDETKKRISNGAKKAHDEGKGHTWKNRYLNPSYAEKWLYELLDSHNIIYEKEKHFFGFFLDVAVGNKCVEIDGEQHYDISRFPEQLERDKRKEMLLEENSWQLLRVRWSEIKKEPEKFANKILNFLT